MVNLNVVEKLVLCILDKEKSSRFLFFDGSYIASIGASAFMELFLEDAISLNDEKKVVIKSELNTDKDYLKEVYKEIQDSKPKKLKKWLETYGAGFSTQSAKNILNGAVESLEKQGVLNVTREQGIFKEKVRYAASEEIVNSIKNEIRKQFLEDGTLTKECVSLTALINGCELLKKDLSRDEKKIISKKLKEMKKNGTVEGIKELQSVVDEIQAVMMAAITASSVH
ncbi:MAG TPA: hypothetical protein DG753_02465 [Clostridium sp.]|nr:hypothetical protein [Clostridium sp.]